MIRERKSIRLKGYDYSSDNLYFITTCVHNRICCFGDIVGTGRDLSLQQNRDPSLDESSIPRMILNEYGEIARQQWNWLSEQYRYVILHAFMVMPNHIHGIIEIKRLVGNLFGPLKIKPLSELMGAYKMTVSKQIHLAGFIEFKWQRSYYEHIIRNEETLGRIKEYIVNNPVNWKHDELCN